MSLTGGEQTKSIAAFVHIEKTAGTSVIHMLRNSLFPGYLDVRPVTGKGYWFLAEDLAWYMNKFPFIRAIGGHSIVPFSSIDNDIQIDYFTVLRHPVDRYVSQYRYWRSHLGKGLSFEDYLEKTNTFNVQTKKLSANRNAAEALDVLQDNFFAIGIVENLTPFVSSLSNYFNTDLKLFDKNRTANSRDKVDSIKEHYMQQILDRNEEDMKLYEWALKQQTNNSNNAILTDSHSFKSYLDYTLRKAVVEPISGMKRKSVGLPYSGSYGLKND